MCDRSWLSEHLNSLYSCAFTNKFPDGHGDVILVLFVVN